MSVRVHKLLGDVRDRLLEHLPAWRRPERVSETATHDGVWPHKRVARVTCKAAAHGDVYSFGQLGAHIGEASVELLDHLRLN